MTELLLAAPLIEAGQGGKKPHSCVSSIQQSQGVKTERDDWMTTSLVHQSPNSARRVDVSLHHFGQNHIATKAWRLGRVNDINFKFHKQKFLNELVSYIVILHFFFSRRRPCLTRKQRKHLRPTMHFISASVFLVLTLLFHMTAALPLPQQKVGIRAKITNNIKAQWHDHQASRHADAESARNHGFGKWRNVDVATRRHYMELSTKGKLASQAKADSYRESIGKKPKHNVPTAGPS